MLALESSNLDPRQKAECFVELHRQYTILPPEDVNLPQELFAKRRERKAKSLNSQDNKSLNEMEYLLEDLDISEFFKRQLVYEFGLEQINGWTTLDEAQEGFIKSHMGINLEENKLGIFDIDSRSVFRMEANFYYNMQTAFRYRKECGANSPVSYEEWGKYICRKALDYASPSSR